MLGLKCATAVCLNYPSIHYVHHFIRKIMASCLCRGWKGPNPLAYVFFILFPCGWGSFEFKILIAHRLICRNIWVSKNIDKIDQVQLIDIEISCLLSVMKASDRVHFPSLDQALGMHLHICSCAQLPLMLF